MYGKHFESMYEGSMYGAGVAVFAIWGYAIARARDSRVELNPKKLANTLGGTVEQMQAALEFLCSPDPESRHKEHEGRRLIREGQFQYFMPSWTEYQKLRNEDERREYNRVKKAEERAKQRANGGTIRTNHRDDQQRKKRNGLLPRKAKPLLSPEEELAAMESERVSKGQEGAIPLQESGDL